MKRKEPTATLLVEEALRTAEDFMSVPMLIAATKQSLNRVHAALHHLRKHRCADVVVEADGRGWWFALPREEDQRSRHVNERTPESKPRKPRKPRAKKEPANV